MPGPITWLYLIVILLVALAGGAGPLLHTDRARRDRGFPAGEAFSSGVFLALALLIMLPASLDTFRAARPELTFPVGGALAIVAFVGLLILEHLARHAMEHAAPGRDRAEAPSAGGDPLVAVIMTVMIAVPSFFLGAALGVSDRATALLIFVAIVLHKGTAAFAIAVGLARSRLGRRPATALLLAFACSTPVGILVGGAAQSVSGPATSLLRGVVLGLAAGTFLFMATLHEMTRAPLIVHCRHRRYFVAMLAGVVVTALVRLVLGRAHVG